MHSSIASRTPGLALAGAVAISVLAAAPSAVAADAATSPAATPAPTPTLEVQRPTSYRLGAHFEADVGLMLVLPQSAGLAGGVVWGPFRAGLSYATFKSNSSFGGTPEGFTMRVNYIVGINASYFIARSTDDGFYVQAMFHIKQQGVTNDGTGDHVDLDSLATGLELGYVWKVYKGLYVAPRVGALYYVKKPQPGNNPVQIGDLSYDNSRHKDWDTYYIPTLSVGYSW